MLNIENNIFIALNVSIGEIFCEVPINYKNIINIKYIENINTYKDLEDFEKEKSYINCGIDSTILDVITGLKKATEILITSTDNNSMYNTLTPTDIIIIDLSQKKINKDGLYLVIDQNALDIRRITIIQENDTIKFSLDNDKFIGNTSKILPRKEAEKLIQGKVLRIIKKDNI